MELCKKIRHYLLTIFSINLLCFPNGFAAVNNQEAPKPVLSKKNVLLKDKKNISKSNAEVKTENNSANKYNSQKSVPTETLKIKSVQSSNGLLVPGMSFYLLMNPVASLDLDGSIKGTSMSGSVASSSALGIGAQYKITEIMQDISADIGGSYEMPRQLSSFSVSGDGKQDNGPFDSPKPQLSLINFYAQASKPLNSKFMVSAGGNYTIPLFQNIGGSWTGKVGYQVGATLLLNSQFAIDGVLRTSQFSGSNENKDNKLVVDNFKMSGLLIRGRYIY
jgi:hypothetical protein